MTRILLTNDDGIHAEGLLALEETLQAISAEVWVVAPATEMSATSHAISLRSPLRFEQLSERKFAVEGTPADSVIMALHKLLPVEPDLVIAGINRGGNMGENVYYSGTLGAAFEAALSGLPAFAVSVASQGDFEFEVAASFAVKLAGKVLREPLPPGVLLNVNVPCPWQNGVRLTRQSDRIAQNVLVESLDPRGRPSFWIHADFDLSAAAPDTDYGAIRAGSISVTPLRLGHTEERVLSAMEDWVADLSHFTVAAD